MSTARFATLIGLALGAVLALSEDFGWTLAAALLTAVGFLVGLVLEGRIDISNLSRSDRESNRTRP
jgi:predicted MFS family arabinose efflux permease